jgi:hypothetical protein
MSNNKLLQKAAEILVESKYAIHSTEHTHIVLVKYEHGLFPESVDPFYSGDNTHRECIARRQADAIEDWLKEFEGKLWGSSYSSTIFDSVITKNHQWRLNRIKYCLEELSK